MSRSDTLPIFLDTYKLLVELYRVTVNFPREYKFSIGQDIQKDAMELFRCIYRANHHQDKIPHLEAYLSEFEIVRIELRLASQLKLLSEKKFAHLSLMMETIGKQATAWRKHEKNRQLKLTGCVQQESETLSDSQLKEQLNQ